MVVALGSERTRWKLAELATEALMVVFAVLVALGVEEWREERQLREFADRARAAVDQEIEQNLAEFRSAGRDLIDGRDNLRDLLQTLGDAQEARDRGESGNASLDFAFDFPDVSTAAWHVAQASRAAPYFDYDWVIERARHYDGLEAYLDVRDEVLDEITSLIAGFGGDLNGAVVTVRRLYGRLEVLVQLHENLQEDMEEYLGESQAN
jgi:hypothetical protein